MAIDIRQRTGSFGQLSTVTIVIDVYPFKPIISNQPMFLSGHIINSGLHKGTLCALIIRGDVIDQVKH